MRVLHVTSELDGGGIDRLLYDYCSRIIPEIQFDFVLTSKNKGILEDSLKDLGCNIYHIPQMHDGLKKHEEALREILTAQSYDIIHIHSGYKAAIDLRIAKKCGIKVRIAHSHVAYLPENAKERFIRLVFTALTKYYATNLFACGQDAAKWMWGGYPTEYI